MKVTQAVTVEKYDVFHVRQLTEATSLQSNVAVDLVNVDPHQTSDQHRHNRADTVLYIMAGAGTVLVADVAYPVAAGDRIHIPPVAWHGVVTGDQPMTFLSIQTPPILDKATGALDLEPRQYA